MTGYDWDSESVCYSTFLHELKFDVKVNWKFQELKVQSDLEDQSFNRISRSVCTLQLLQLLHHRIIQIQNVWITGALGRVYLACRHNTTCNILQRTASRNALQHTATYCNTFQPNATKCNIKALNVYVCRVTFIRPALHCIALRCASIHCNALQHRGCCKNRRRASPSSDLQHTTTPCSTL